MWSSCKAHDAPEWHTPFQASCNAARRRRAAAAFFRINGIDRAADDVGFQRLVIRPVPSGHCRHASGSHRSLRGTITTNWRIANDCSTTEVAVPPNCTAEVHVPICLGAAGAQLDGARHLRDSVTHAIFAVGSGTWSFSVFLRWN